MHTTVVKKDGRVETFSLDKLRRSIEKAVLPVGLSEKDVESLINELLDEIEKEKTPHTSNIADRIARLMVVRGISNPKWFEAAKRFELARIYNDVYGKNGWEKFDERDLLLSFNAIKVLEARYLIKDPKTWRFRETPQMMFRRVAKHIASVEQMYGKTEEEVRKLEDEFYEIMSNLKFIPNSPTLMNAGTRLGILSACFVVPVRDSMTTSDGEGIMDAVRAQALIHQHGGGTGYDFSELRPENDIVTSSGGFASGPLSFMKLFDAATDVIKQGGKRRGANMGVMHVWHPDIEKFIKAKTGKLKDVNLQNFNISVGFYDSFLRAVVENGKWPLINPRLTDLRKGEGYDSRYYAIVRARHYLSEEWVQEVIIDELEQAGGSIGLDESIIVTLDEALVIAEEEGAIVKWIDAAKLFDEIIKGAWDSGDPGYLNIDVINRRHPTWFLGKINATNPCVSGDTRILTPSGWIRAEELYRIARAKGKAVPVEIDKNYLGEGGSPIAYEIELVTSIGEEAFYRNARDANTLHLQVPRIAKAWVWHIGRKPALKVKTKEGYEITVTREHRFLTLEGWKEAGDLKKGDKILLGRLHPALINDIIRGEYNLDSDIAFALGWLIGKGSINKDNVAWFFTNKDYEAESRVRRGIAKLGGNPLSHTKSSILNQYKVEYNNKSTVYKNVVGLIGTNNLDLEKNSGLPEITWRLSLNSLIAFLRGLFTAKGSIDREGSIKLNCKSMKLLKDLQIILTSLGIYSEIHESNQLVAHRESVSNGKFELVIKGYSIMIFRKLIAFENIKKIEELMEVGPSPDSIWATVKEIEEAGLVDFYDFTVPITHSYIANGIINHNCGEEPLLPWESCNLGSINLEKYVVEENGEKNIDWEGLARDIRIAVRFLDNVIDANNPPLPQIKEATRRTRKVGLGVMGWARMLIRLGIPYDSPDAIVLAWYLSEWIAWNAYMESTEIAREKGSFPTWDPLKYRWIDETLPLKSVDDYLKIVAEETRNPSYIKPVSVNTLRIIEKRPKTDWNRVKERAKRNGLRNAALLSIAPTGTISIIAGASSSIEPLFALAFLRRVSVGEFFEVDPLFLEELSKREMDEPEVIEEIAQTGSIRHLKWIPRTLRKIFKTAHDIDPEWHLLHQAVWQAWVDAGTSKTINLRNEEPVETVRRIYLLAWKLGVKGTTVYRDKSKSQQVIYFGVKKEREKEEKLTREKTIFEKEIGKQKIIEIESQADDEPSLIIEPEKPEEKVEAASTSERRETRQTTTRKKLRLGKGKVSKIIEVVVANEDYAGGCPTCDI